MFLHWLNFVYRKKPFPPQYPFRIYSPLFKVFTLFLDTRKSPSLIFFIGRCPIFTNISPCPPLVFYSAPIQAYRFICKKISTYYIPSNCRIIFSVFLLEVPYIRPPIHSYHGPPHLPPGPPTPPPSHPVCRPGLKTRSPFPRYFLDPPLWFLS